MSSLRCITLGLFLLPSIVFSEPLHVLTGSTWNLSADDGTYTWNETTLVFTSQSLVGNEYDIQGYFDWVGSGGQFGRELFTGKYLEDETLEFSGFELQNRSGIVTATYTAKVSATGRELVDGSWTGGLPGVWSAQR